MTKYFLVADVGTTGVKALVFSSDLKVKGRAYARLKKTRPHPGWVEQSPREIVELTKKVLRDCVRGCGVPLKALHALGITNQRETTIVWDRRTGKPVYPAIVWEDKRTAPECARLRHKKLEPMVREKTGLTIDPYFSATKVEWILRHYPSPPPSPAGRGGLKVPSFAKGWGLRASPRPLGEGQGGGDLLFGTVDTWVLWNLLEGNPHLTDWTNASRTLLYNIRSLKWDDELLRVFGVPREILPEVRPSQSHFGFLHKEILGVRLPVLAVCGDQQASMYGAGVRPGATKVTYGTGTFLVQALGSKYVLKRPFFTTLMPSTRRPGFALEAKIEGSGAKIDRVLHDDRKLDQALTRIAKDVEVYLNKLTIRPKDLVVDGGITRDGKIVAIQARVSGIEVRRQSMEDGTALGVAKLLRDN